MVKAIIGFFAQLMTFIGIVLLLLGAVNGEPISIVLLVVYLLFTLIDPDRKKS